MTEIPDDIREAAERWQRWASELSDDDLLAEQAEVAAVIANGFGEHGGSPGEWYYERADEVRHQIEKRKAAAAIREATP